MQNLQKIFRSKQFKTESPIEKLIVEKLVEYDFRGFETQYEVEPYRIDIAFPKHKVGLELDGHAYHSTKAQQARDELRDEYLTSQGWKMERIQGYMARRYPLIPIAKAFRNIPEYHGLKIYEHACSQLQSWYLISRYIEEGK